MTPLITSYTAVLKSLHRQPSLTWKPGVGVKDNQNLLQLLQCWWPLSSFWPVLVGTSSSWYCQFCPPVLMKLFVSSVVRHNSVSVSQSSSRTALFTLFGFIRITSVNPTWFWMDPFWKFWNKISWFDFFTSQEPDVLTGVETFYFHCVFIQMSSTAEELVMSQNLKWSRCFQVLQSSLFSCMFFSLVDREPNVVQWFYWQRQIHLSDTRRIRIRYCIDVEQN